MPSFFGGPLVLALAATLACVADAFHPSLALRSPAAGGFCAGRAPALKRAQAGGVRGLALSGGDKDGKESVLKRLASIDNERASPKKEDDTPKPPFPEWAYVVMPILGVATAFIFQLVKAGQNAPPS